MQKNQSFFVVGVMSGTSLDGIDLSLVEFKFKDNEWRYNFISSNTEDYSTDWRARLAQARYKSKIELETLDSEYTSFLGDKIREFIESNSKYPIDLVCSHGHTVFHEPDKGITYQMGNKKELSDIVNHTVVCDFRVQDVSLGGQGAPLVPGGEFYLFKEYVACVNLGGFANISLLDGETPIAYDIAAANLVLNRFSVALNLPYDSGGKIASEGFVIPEFLLKLNELSYYDLKPPKSLGVEWITDNLESVFEEFKDEYLPDLMHTYCVHLADQISRVLPKQGKVLFSGGGTHNTFLIELIDEKSSAEIVIPSIDLIDFKEALIFGFLGLLKYLSQDNCFASVTGSKHNHSTGVILKK